MFDKQGFIFALAVGALALIFFTWYFLKISSKRASVVMKDKIESVEDLNSASDDLDSQSPDALNVDLNANSADSSGL